MRVLPVLQRLLLLAPALAGNPWQGPTSNVPDARGVGIIDTHLDSGVLLPSWQPTWLCNESTMIQPCNEFGPLDLTMASQWGVTTVISFNDMAGSGGWLFKRPMNEQEDELAQARLIQGARADKTRFPGAVPGRTWLYRQSVKAEPWDTAVRAKLDDPAYHGFFLHYAPGYNYSWPICNAAAGVHKPGCNTWPACDRSKPKKCSKMYHDQVGKFAKWTTNGSLDCGTQPCGEYLFDYRNGSMLREWMLSDLFFGPSAMGSPLVTGLFVDDDWNAKGLTEEGPGWQEEMGLTAADLRTMQKEYATMLLALQKKIVAAGGFLWQLMNCFHAPVDPTGPVPPPDSNGWCHNSWQTAPNRSQILSEAKAQCTAWHRSVCVKSAPLSRIALFFGWTRVAHAQPYTAAGALPAFMQDLASFLLTRGPYAWLGTGWISCRSEFPHPAELNEDFGEPLSSDCWEVGTPGVFARAWSKANVSVDCRDFSATIKMHDGRVLRSAHE